jgi:SMI1 / KNR4 family (SUKH-1)
MSAGRSVLDVLRVIRAGGPTPVPPVPVEGMPPMEFASAVAGRGASPQEFSALPVQCPPGLREFWEAALSARLFEDRTYGQWGLEILDPVEAAEATAELQSARPGEFVRGDLVIGRFLGDSDLVLVRCDPTSHDYGRVTVCTPIDPRPSWDVVADSFEAFFDRYVLSGGDKFWETAAGGDGREF